MASKEDAAIVIQLMHAEKAVKIGDEILYYSAKEWRELKKLLKEKGICV